MTTPPSRTMQTVSRRGLKDGCYLELRRKANESTRRSFEAEKFARVLPQVSGCGWFEM